MYRVHTCASHRDSKLPSLPKNQILPLGQSWHHPLMNAYFKALMRSYPGWKPTHRTSQSPLGQVLTPLEKLASSTCAHLGPSVGQTRTCPIPCPLFPSPASASPLLTDPPSGGLPPNLPAAPHHPLPPRAGPPVPTPRQVPGQRESLKCSKTSGRGEKEPRGPGDRGCRRAGGGHANPPATGPAEPPP